MPLPNVFPYREALATWVDIDSWTAPVAATFTMKQALQADDGRLIRLTRDLASENFRHFLKRLNYKLYGNAAHRYRRRVTVCPVLEMSAADRLHYHAVFDVPPSVTPDEFRQFTLECWSSTHWAHSQSDIQFQADSGWAAYILKMRTKTEFDLDIDLANWHLPCSD